MGWYIAYGYCICCEKPFYFNPHKVPSTRVATGKREPVCHDCVDRVNQLRVSNGHAPIIPDPDAYSETEE